MYLEKKKLIKRTTRKKAVGVKQPVPFIRWAAGILTAVYQTVFSQRVYPTLKKRRQTFYTFFVRISVHCRMQTNNSTVSGIFK